MIIKSMSRKTPSFGQLFLYINKDADPDYIYTRNVYFAGIEDQKGLLDDFKDNYKALKKQKNSNALYHEIISVTRAGIDLKKQKEILYKIVDGYVQARAEKCLVYGALHENKENNLHFHLMISSNQIGAERNHYFSKKEYNEIQKQIEAYVLREYPEIEQGIVLNKPKRERARSQAEYEFKKRTGKQTKREVVKERLRRVFAQTTTKQAFFDRLYTEKLEIYVKGKNIGFKDLNNNGRKYRLNRLGLADEFEKMSDIIKKQLVKQKKGKGEKVYSKQNKQNVPETEKERVFDEDYRREKLKQMRREEKNRERSREKDRER